MKVTIHPLQQRGFSLPELLISMALTALLLALLSRTFIGTQQTWATARAQSEGGRDTRGAIALLENDLKHHAATGETGGIHLVDGSRFLVFARKRADEPGDGALKATLWFVAPSPETGFPSLYRRYLDDTAARLLLTQDIGSQLASVSVQESDEQIITRVLSFEATALYRNRFPPASGSAPDAPQISKLLRVNDWNNVIPPLAMDIVIRVVSPSEAIRYAAINWQDPTPENPNDEKGVLNLSTLVRL